MVSIHNIVDVNYFS